jgi:hypothetical protein
VNPPGLTEYIQLIQLFINPAISAGEFERRYLRMFKDDPTIRPEAEYDVLNRLFSDLDVYLPDPGLRSAGGLDEEQLRSTAAAAFGVLVELSQHTS